MLGTFSGGYRKIFFRACAAGSLPSLAVRSMASMVLTDKEEKYLESMRLSGMQPFPYYLSWWLVLVPWQVLAMIGCWCCCGCRCCCWTELYFC